MPPVDSADGVRRFLSLRLRLVLESASRDAAAGACAFSLLSDIPDGVWNIARTSNVPDSTGLQVGGF